MSDNRWDAFCWDFDAGVWFEMWRNFSIGDDDADVIEAYFETGEDQSGTIFMGTVQFYGLELKDSNSDWHDWDSSYASDTDMSEQGGYTITTNSTYYDFEVDN